jgi:hypothetical protein
MILWTRDNVSLRIQCSVTQREAQGEARRREGEDEGCHVRHRNTAPEEHPLLSCFLPCPREVSSPLRMALATTTQELRAQVE